MVVSLRGYVADEATPARARQCYNPKLQRGDSPVPSLTLAAIR